MTFKCSGSVCKMNILCKNRAEKVKNFNQNQTIQLYIIFMDEIQIKSTYIYFLATPAARGGPGWPVAATWSFLAPPGLSWEQLTQPGGQGSLQHHLSLTQILPADTNFYKIFKLF